MLQAIYTLGPLVIGMSAGLLADYNNQVLLTGRTDKFCAIENGQLDFNHAVLVVGYQNSTELADGTKAGGSFIIKNSWNTDWGVAGAMLLNPMLPFHLFILERVGICKRLVN